MQTRKTKSTRNQLLDFISNGYSTIDAETNMLRIIIEDLKKMDGLDIDASLSIQEYSQLVKKYFGKQTAKIF